MPVFAEITLSDESETLRFAQDIASALLPGDVVALQGGLGAGKTTFSRFIIRALSGNDALEVPSPTFSLMQPYEARIPIRHFDLYRLSHPEELEEIGFFDGLETNLTLIEWPEQAGENLPEGSLVVSLEITKGDERKIQLSGEQSGTSQRILRTLAAREFMESAGFTSAQRLHVQGDVSHRSYERLASANKPPAIFMNAPQTPKGDLLENGRTYADTVHRAPDTKPFERIAGQLRNIGLSAPEIYAHDSDAGFMILEDFGRLGVLDHGGKPDKERYLRAVETLAILHDNASSVDESLAPTFDEAAFLTELTLFTTHFALHRGFVLGDGDLGDFFEIWQSLFVQLQNAEKGLILRDVHAPNLMWLPDRRGVKQIGLLDFQDALWGPQIYDLASLVFDARVTVSADARSELLAHYLQLRSTGLSEFNWESHLRILATQRILKILGIFARVAKVDAKLSYLDHMPRNIAYLRELLDHPELADLNRWHQRVFPLN